MSTVFIKTPRGTNRTVQETIGRIMRAFNFSLKPSRGRLQVYVQMTGGDRYDLTSAEVLTFTNAYRLTGFVYEIQVIE